MNEIPSKANEKQLMETTFSASCFSVSSGGMDLQKDNRWIFMMRFEIVRFWVLKITKILVHAAVSVRFNYLPRPGWGRRGTEISRDSPDGSDGASINALALYISAAQLHTLDWFGSREIQSNGYNKSWALQMPTGIKLPWSKLLFLP